MGSRDLNFDGRFKIFDKGLQGTKVKDPVTFHFGSGHFREIQTTLIIISNFKSKKSPLSTFLLKNGKKFTKLVILVANLQI